MVCMETALPAKFEDTIREALGEHFVVPRPDRWQDIEKSPQRLEIMPNNADAVKMFMRERIEALDKARKE